MPLFLLLLLVLPTRIAAQLPSPISTVPIPKVSLYMICKNPTIQNWQDRVQEYFDSIWLASLPTLNDWNIQVHETDCLAQDVVQYQVQLEGSLKVVLPFTFDRSIVPATDLAQQVTESSLKNAFGCGEGSDLLVWNVDDDDESLDFQAKVAKRLCDITEDQSTLTLGAIVGISVGVTLCLSCLLGVLLYCCCCDGKGNGK